MGLFGNGGSAAQKITRYTSLDIQTSALGVCIPLLWGRNRIGCNLIWTGNFISKPVSGKGGGKGGGGKGGGTYDYWCALIAALCEGTIQDVLQCWQDQQSESLSYWNLGLVTGTQSQAIPSWFTSNFPSQSLSYAGTAYVWSQKYSLGESATLPNLTFEVDGYLSGTCSIAGIPDANPADIINDYLTNSLYGLDPGATYIDSTSLSTYRTYCLAQALLLSPYLRTQEQATQTLQRWAQLTNSWIFWNGVEMKFVPLGDATITSNGVTYTPNLTPIYALDESDFIPDSKDGPLVTVTRIDPADGYNRVEIDNRNRNDLYNTDPTYWEDSTSVSTFGQLQSQTVTADEVCDPNVAAIMASLIGQRSVYIRNTYEFTLDYSYILLEPGDIVTLTDSNIGIITTPVRITDVSEDDKGYLKFGAEECPGSVGISSAHPKQSVTNNIVNTQVDPGVVNPPLIIEPPVSLTGGVPELWIGASGGANWGGAQIWVSADGTNYASVGQVTSPIIQGTLSASLALHVDPDNSNTISVNLTESDTTLPTSFTSADANAYRTASLIDNEIISFGTSTSTGAFTYNLTGLRRGVYNTTPASHSTGAQFYWISSADTFTYSLPQAYVGTTLYFKFLSFNQFGNALEQLSGVSAYTYTPTGVGYTIAPPTSASTAVTRTTQADGTTLLNMTVSWTASTGPNLAGYNVSWSTNGGSTYSTPIQVGSAATSYTLTPAVASTNYIFRVQAYSQNGLALSTYATAASVSSGTLVASVPSAPSGVTATAVGTQAQIAWTSGPQTNLFYTISRASGTGASFSSASIVGYGAQGSTTFLDTSTSASTAYTYFVQASNAAGTSSASSGVNCTTGTVATSIVVEVNNTVDAVGTISFNAGLLGTVSSGTLELSVPTQLTLESQGTTETASFLNFGSNLTATLASGTLTIQGAPQTYFESSGTVVSANTLNVSSGLTASVASGTLTLTSGGGGGGAGTLELYQGGSYTPFGTLVATNGVTAAVSSGTATLQGLSYANQGTLIGGSTVAGSTWNPSYVGGSSTLSGGNLTFNGSNTGSYNWTMCIAQSTNTTGVTKFYWEITTGSQTGSNTMIGLATYGAALGAWMGSSDSSGIGFEGQGSVWYAGNGSYETGITYGASTTIGIAWDVNAGKLWFNIGGSWVSGNPATGTGGSTMPVVGTPHPAVAVLGSGSSATANFGSSTFAYSVPTGFTAYGAASIAAVNLSEINFSTNLSAVLSGSTLTVTAPQQLTLESAGTVVSASTLNAGTGIAMNSGGTITTVGQQPFDLLVFNPGTLASSQKLVRAVMARQVVFPTNFSGSYVGAGTAATASNTLTISNGVTQVGSIVIPASSSTGTISVASATTITAGGTLNIVNQATADVTLADLSLTLTGVR
jgi:hypothetical protein